MADDPFAYQAAPLDDDPYGMDAATSQILAGLLSPTDAQTLESSPPVAPAVSGPGQSTPRTGSLATAPQQAQPRVSGPAMLPGIATKPENLNNGPATLAPRLAAQQQAYAQRYPGAFAAAPATPTGLASIPGYRSNAPSMPATAQPSVVPDKLNMRTQQDQDQLGYYQDSGSGISQIKNPWLRGLATAGDIAETIVAPGIERITPGTVGNNQRLQVLAQGRVNSDQAQQQARATLEDIQSQKAQRDAQAAREAAQAQADTTRQPTPQEAADYNLDPNAFYRPSDIGKAAVQAAKNRATLQTHTGGQSHKLTADDAALVGAPALEGETISNDAWQKMVSGVQRNTQSGKNTAANNATRVQTTGMRDATSTGNSNRAHQPKGAGAAPKPIPAAVKDRIESQKNTAISKAKAAYDTGDTDLQGYLTAWQQAQDGYEDRISAQTGQPVAHTDIRRNVDSRGNWRGGNQPAAAQPQAQQPANRPAFITRKGSAVALGDPVNVNGRKGTVTGFNPTTGKAQVRWEAAQ